MTARLPLFALLGLLVTGCGLPLPPPIERYQAGQRLARADELVRAGRYQDARDTYLRLLEEHPTFPAADHALFSLGRLHALPDNPNRDYREAHRAFDRLVTEFPQSPWTEEARPWRDLLAALIERGHALAASEREAERLRQELEQARRRHREEVAHGRRDSERLRQEAERARREAQRLEQYLERLKAMEVELERQRR
jgi:tetratricopeptide (TPR) repeat protein